MDMKRFVYIYVIFDSQVHPCGRYLEPLESARRFEPFEPLDNTFEETSPLGARTRHSHGLGEIRKSASRPVPFPLP